MERKEKGPFKLPMVTPGGVFSMPAEARESCALSIFKKLEIERTRELPFFFCSQYFAVHLLR